jgi:hypothetical protein
MGRSKASTRLLAMERMGKIFATMIAGVFLLPPAGSADEIVCKEQRVKKLPHICGSVISPLGEPVPNAKVMIFTEGLELVEVQSHVKLRSASDVRRSEVRALLEQAEELNRKEPVPGTKVQMKQSRAAGTRKSGRRATTPD